MTKLKGNFLSCFQQKRILVFILSSFNVDVMDKKKTQEKMGTALKNSLESTNMA